MDAENTDAFCSIDGERPTLVIPRVYALRFTHHETARMFGRAMKLILWFKIAEAGDDFEKPIPKYYNVTKLIGPVGKNGAFKVGFRSDLLREYATLFGAPSRLDRIAMSKFHGAFIMGKVKTVTSGHTQREIPKPLQYSVVEELRELRK